MLALFGQMVGFVVDLFRSRMALQAEILVLRQQITVLRQRISVLIGIQTQADS